MEEPVIKVYVACPTIVSLNTLSEVCKLIRGYGGTPYYWTRGSYYNPNIMDDADIVVAITPNERVWRTTRKVIPKGTLSEIDKALQYQKPLFTTYLPSHGLTIYKATQSGKGGSDTFGGIAGTGGELRDLIIQMKKDIKLKQAFAIAEEEYSEVDLVTGERVVRVKCSDGIIRNKKISTGEYNPSTKQVDSYLKIEPSIPKERDWVTSLSDYTYLPLEEREKLLLLTIK